MPKPQQSSADTASVPTQKRFVTHARQPLFFIIGRQARQVVDLSFLDLDDGFARGRGQGRLLQKLFERNPAEADDELVGAKGFLIEEHAALQTEAFIELEVLSRFGKFHHVDAERRQQACGDRTVGSRTIDFQGAAVQ